MRECSNRLKPEARTRRLTARAAATSSAEGAAYTLAATAADDEAAAAAAADDDAAADAAEGGGAMRDIGRSEQEGAKTCRVQFLESESAAAVCLSGI